MSMQVTQVMCRASRQVVNELSKYADASGVQGFLIPAHLYICDYMVIKYHQAAVINVIRQHITKIPPPKREYKHFTPMYWYRIIDNILGKQENAKKTYDGEVHGEMTDYNSFNHFTKIYLSDDYSVHDALLINQICNTYTLDEIVRACKTATDKAVHSIAYVMAILKDMDATKRAEELRIRMLGEKIEKSSIQIQTETHTHTPIELAKSEYDYQKKRNDMILELMLQKMMGGNSGDKK